MVGYHQTNQKTNTGKTLTRWPVLVDHNTCRGVYLLIEIDFIVFSVEYK